MRLNIITSIYNSSELKKKRENGMMKIAHVMEGVSIRASIGRQKG